MDVIINFLRWVFTGPYSRQIIIVMMNVFSFFVGGFFGRVRSWLQYRKILQEQAQHELIEFYQVGLRSVKRLALNESDGETQNVLSLICIGTPAEPQVFGKEGALFREWLQRAKRTTASKTLIDMSGRLGSHILSRFVSWVEAAHSQHERQRTKWILVAVNEKSQILRNRSPRVYLVTESSLAYFSLWQNCLETLVEEPWHVAHLVALHDAGKAYQSFAVDYLERRQRNEPDEFEETMREVALALNETWPEDTRYYTPNWKEVAEILEAKELPLPE